MAKKYTLGIDIGITSVGWGIIDDNNEIIASGVRLFEEADSENNLKRRNFRSARRIKSRKKLRVMDMRQLLFNNSVIPTLDYVPFSNPYAAREKGLTEKLSSDELASALIHLSKRRGSSLETVEEEVKNQESPKLVLQQHAKLIKKGLSVVQIQMKKLNDEGIVRGHQNVFKTTDYLDETKAILNNQEMDDKFNQSVIEIINRRRHFSEGPGNLLSPTPYGRYRSVDGSLKNDMINCFDDVQKRRYKQERFHFTYENAEYLALKNGEIVNKNPLNLIELMRGKCSIYNDQLRAPKGAVSAEIYNLLNDLNNLRIVTQDKRKLSKDEKTKVLDYLIENGYFKPKGFKGLAKFLGVEMSELSGMRESSAALPLITELEHYHKIKKVIDSLDIQKMKLMDYDFVAEVLTSTQVLSERRSLLQSLKIKQQSIEAIANLTGFNGYHAFSFKALYILNKELVENEMNAQQLILDASIDINKDKLALSDKIILSPVARRAQKEALKVVEELRSEFGNFDRIVVETTREKNSKEQKSNIQKAQKTNMKSRTEAEVLVQSVTGNDSYRPSGMQILKIRLYNEQDGKCAYTGLPIDFNRMITDPKAYEVDHILPFSISLDDSYDNKVLVISDVNQLKGNKTPFGYFTSGKVRKHFPIQNFEIFKISIESNANYNAKKKAYLLEVRDITKYSQMKEFINRNLVDTSYAVRMFMMTLKEYFEVNGIPTSVLTIKGKQTSLFRRIGRSLWYRAHQNEEESLNPFDKDRQIYMHHAVDALIVAALSRQRLFNYLYKVDSDTESNYATLNNTGELFEADPKEDSSLVMYLKQLGNLDANDVRYSWKRDSKYNRSVSDQTIYSTRVYDKDEYVVYKLKDIYSKKQKELDPFFGAGDKKETLLMYKHDIETYELIRQAFDQYKHEQYPLQVFADNHGKIRKNNKGPVVTDVKYVRNKLGNHINITPENYSGNKKIILQQISSVRADIYQSKEGLYRFVTIRYAEVKNINHKFVIDEAVYQNKLNDKGIDHNYEFRFSLYRNDLIEFDDGQKTLLRYIAVANDKNNVIEFKYYDKVNDERIMKTLGRSTANITKYNVTPAGKKYKVYKEPLKLII
ncbi:MAG: type II CRISPR RNA-guided endonuclease Cas9 [Acholeplasma sp.]|nr:type II CRISPR RNA-guided endonuclease Cas9 [Acholeplasma sp.]